MFCCWQPFTKSRIDPHLAEEGALTSDPDEFVPSEKSIASDDVDG
jgi:hypothetical protein